jgi:isopentenyl diphosphate isomerase/L-lactate dehydrogenase-like FMN-dependent dehydrogenase
MRVVKIGVCTEDVTGAVESHANHVLCHAHGNVNITSVWRDVANRVADQDATNHVKRG